jgi:hypothetical protein
MIHPAPNGLVGDHDAAFRQQVFDVTETQCEPEIEPDRVLDDLWRKAVAAIADFLHSRGYRTASGTASPKRRDKALAPPHDHHGRYQCEVNELGLAPGRWCVAMVNASSVMLAQNGAAPRLSARNKIPGTVARVPMTAPIARSPSISAAARPSPRLSPATAPTRPGPRQARRS